MFWDGLLDFGGVWYRHWAVCVLTIRGSCGGVTSSCARGFESVHLCVLARVALACLYSRCSCARRASDHYAHVCLFMCLCSLCWHSHVCMSIAHVLVVSLIVVLVLFALVFTCLYGCCLRARRVDDHVLDIWCVACGACT